MKNILTQFSLYLNYETDDSRNILNAIKKELSFSTPDSVNPGR